MNTFDGLNFELNPENLQYLKPPSAQQISRKNDQEGLRAIARFGWLRAREIGNVLWQTQPNRHISGARIARKWTKNRWVMQRTLPYGYGPAYVLTKKGADYLSSEFDIDDANSGKKIGDHIENSSGTWMPSKSWRHDLLANSFLTLCMGGGAEVMSELEIRRKFPGSKKIPDGLFMLGEDWHAIEVERAEKWSRELRQLVKSVVSTHLDGIEFGETRVNNVCLVYEDPNIEINDDRKRYDHFGRIKRAAGGILTKGQKFTLVGIPVALKGGAVHEITEPLVEVIGESYEGHRQKSIFGHKWMTDDSGVSSVRFSSYRPFSVQVFKEKKSWNVEIAFNSSYSTWVDIVRSRLDSETEIDAKRKALELLLERPEYVSWFDSKWFAEEIAAEKEAEEKQAAIKKETDLKVEKATAATVELPIPAEKKAGLISRIFRVR